MIGGEHVQSSEDESDLMGHVQASGMRSLHARTGLMLQPSSSTPALPTHLARMSETADVDANYMRGACTAAPCSNILSVCLSTKFSTNLLASSPRKSEDNPAATNVWVRGKAEQQKPLRPVQGLG